MTDWLDWAYDYDDLQDWEDDDFADTNVTCKFCGTNGLYWGEVEHKKWRLFHTDTDKLHNCLRPPSKKYRVKIGKQKPKGPENPKDYEFQPEEDDDFEIPF